MTNASTTIRPDRASSALVTAGPFGFSRNPLYLSQLLLMVGLACVLDGVAPLIAMVLQWAGLNWMVIPREEHHLAARFPAEFAAYRARVRRWL